MQLIKNDCCLYLLMDKCQCMCCLYTSLLLSVHIRVAISPAAARSECVSSQGPCLPIVSMASGKQYWAS